MATYSEWIEPPVYEQLIEVGGSDLDPLPSGTPRTRLRFDSDTVGTGSIDNELTSDPAGEHPAPSLSQFVWDNLPMDDPLEDADDGDTDLGQAAKVQYLGTHYWFIGPPGRYVQYDKWWWSAARYRLSQRSGTGGYFYHRPELPPGATGIEYEDSSLATPTLLSAEVDPLFGAEAGRGLNEETEPYWSLFIKPQGVTPGLWREGISRRGILDAINISNTGYTLSADELASLEAMMFDVDRASADDRDTRWLQLALAYTGPWPGALPGSPPAYAPNSWSYEVSPTLVMRVTYRPASRYRFVYDSVPYRRIFPRDDGLAGGAPRVYPASKAVQSSNRVGGGYL